MSDLIILTPNVLVGGTDPVARARAYVGRELGSEEGIDQAIVAALNGATGKIERRVNRGLRVRTYREAVTISCDTTVDDQTLTAASGLLALKVDDDAVGASLALGSRIASITSDAALELTRKATSGDAMTVTFGSAPIILDGQATDYIYIPERPVVEVGAREPAAMREEERAGRAPEAIPAKAVRREKPEAATVGARLAKPQAATNSGNTSSCSISASSNSRPL